MTIRYILYLLAINVSCCVTMNVPTSHVWRQEAFIGQSASCMLNAMSERSTHSFLPSVLPISLFTSVVHYFSLYNYFLCYEYFRLKDLHGDLMGRSIRLLQDNTEQKILPYVKLKGSFVITIGDIRPMSNKSHGSKCLRTSRSDSL